MIQGCFIDYHLLTFCDWISGYSPDVYLICESMCACRACLPGWYTRVRERQRNMRLATSNTIEDQSQRSLNDDDMWFWRVFPNSCEIEGRHIVTRFRILWFSFVITHTSILCVCRACLRGRYTGVHERSWHLSERARQEPQDRAVLQVGDLCWQRDRKHVWREATNGTVALRSWCPVVMVMVPYNTLQFVQLRN